jgi:hypothetical protein
MLLATGVVPWDWQMTTAPTALFDFSEWKPGYNKAN